MASPTKKGKKTKSTSKDLVLQIEKKLTKASPKGTINCKSALAIAKALKVPSTEVGRIADSLKIKISSCQLGCF